MLYTGVIARMLIKCIVVIIIFFREGFLLIVNKYENNQKIFAYVVNNDVICITQLQ